MNWERATKYYTMYVVLCMAVLFSVSNEHMDQSLGLVARLSPSTLYSVHTLSSRPFRARMTSRVGVRKTIYRVTVSRKIHNKVCKMCTRGV